MTPVLARLAGPAALLLLVGAALIPAFGLPYPLAIVTAGAALALVFVPAALARKGVRVRFDAVAAANGQEARPQDDDGSRWLADRGFSDLAGQRVTRFTVRRFDCAGGVLSLVAGRVGQGKNPLVLYAVVFTVPVSTPGEVCLYTRSSGNTRRAKWLGGSVSTGTAIDRAFVAFSPDPGGAADAARALDADAVKALLRRVRELGARADPAFAVKGGLASLLVYDAPATLLAPLPIREVMEGLANSNRTSR